MGYLDTLGLMKRFIAEALKPITIGDVHRTQENSACR